LLRKSAEEDFESGGLFGEEDAVVLQPSVISSPSLCLTQDLVCATHDRIGCEEAQQTQLSISAEADTSIVAE